jgi:hypothetical protein
VRGEVDKHWFGFLFRFTFRNNCLSLEEQLESACIPTDNKFDHIQSSSRYPLINLRRKRDHRPLRDPSRERSVRLLDHLPRPFEQRYADLSSIPTIGTENKHDRAGLTNECVYGFGGFSIKLPQFPLHLALQIPVGSFGRYIQKILQDRCISSHSLWVDI